MAILVHYHGNVTTCFNIGEVTFMSSLEIQLANTLHWGAVADVARNDLIQITHPLSIEFTSSCGTNMDLIFPWNGEIRFIDVKRSQYVHTLSKLGEQTLFGRFCGRRCVVKRVHSSLADTRGISANIALSAAIEDALTLRSGGHHYLRTFTC